MGGIETVNSGDIANIINALHALKEKIWLTNCGVQDILNIRLVGN
jgi:hypothetical protein